MSAIREVLYTIGRQTSGLVPKLSLVLGSIALVAMVVFVVAAVIGRNVFSYGIPFTIEYSEYMVPVVGVIGAAYCLSKEGHVRVVVLLQQVPDRPRRWISLLGFILGLGFTTLCSVLAFKMALLAIQRGDKAYYPTETLVGYPQLILGIGLALFSLQLVIEIFRQARQLV